MWSESVYVHLTNLFEQQAQKKKLRRRIFKEKILRRVATFFVHLHLHNTC